MLHGEHLLQGFRNRDVRTRLFGPSATPDRPADDTRITSKITLSNYDANALVPILEFDIAEARTASRYDRLRGHTPHAEVAMNSGVIAPFDRFQQVAKREISKNPAILAYGDDVIFTQALLNALILILPGAKCKFCEINIGIGASGCNFVMRPAAKIRVHKVVRYSACQPASPVRAIKYQGHARRDG